MVILMTIRVVAQELSMPPTSTPPPNTPLPSTPLPSTPLPISRDGVEDRVLYHVFEETVEKAIWKEPITHQL